MTTKSVNFEFRNFLIADKVIKTRPAKGLKRSGTALSQQVASWPVD